MPKTTYIIAGDIGGTTSRFSLHRLGQREPLHGDFYANEIALANAPDYHHATLKPYLEQCLAEVEEWRSMGEDAIISQVQVVVCLATAGPVKTNNTVFMTNMGEGGIAIDGNEIEKCQDGLLSVVVRCKLINDFVGQGYGSLDLDLENECVELMPGSIEKIDGFGPRACVGAGTGLGVCFLTKSSLSPGLGYECYPSEGGHVDFVPRDTLSVELWEYLKERHRSNTRISVERVVSGRGLADVYEFLAQKFSERVDDEIHDEFLKASDQKGGVVGRNSGIAGSLTKQAMELVIACYGAAVGNASLTFIPTGGMFVTGGLTPKHIGMIKGIDSPFVKAYLDKGRLRPVLDTIPLFAVMVEDIGLRGARVCAEQEFHAMNICVG